MRILVVNGSPKGDNSDTMKITRAFIDGIGETADVVNTYASEIRPCKGCFACWQGNGKCVQNDDVEAILKKITEADLVIWSTPLYCYGMTSTVKALVERLLPLSSPAMYTDESGHTHHVAKNRPHAKMFLISGCGFPDFEGNFDGIIFAFRRLFGSDAQMILCPEAPLLSIPEAEPVALPYLDKVRAAGRELRDTGKIASDTLAALSVPMISADLYRAGSNKK